MLLCVDISKAYLHAPVMRNDIYDELPAEMEQPGCCGRLRKALYGTREAASYREHDCVRMLESIGFRRGSTSPCAFWHKDKGLQLVVHGDYFTSSGTEDELRWLLQEFEKKFVTKVRGIVGPDSHDLRSMTVLNRILEWMSDQNTFEADHRHVDMIINGMGLVNGKGSDVVGSAAEQSEGEEEMGKDDAFRFRSLAARCNFLGVGQMICSTLASRSAVGCRLQGHATGSC